MQKSGVTYTDTIYMQQTANPNPIQSIDGKTGNRYDNFIDAITRAYELGAPYSGATITIKLGGSGVYGFLRSKYGYY